MLTKWYKSQSDDCWREKNCCYARDWLHVCSTWQCPWAAWHEHLLRSLDVLGQYWSHWDFPWRMNHESLFLIASLLTSMNNTRNQWLMPCAWITSGMLQAGQPSDVYLHSSHQVRDNGTCKKGILFLCRLSIASTLQPLWRLRSSNTTTSCRRRLGRFCLPLERSDGSSAQMHSLFQIAILPKNAARSMATQGEEHSVTVILFSAIAHQVF